MKVSNWKIRDIHGALAVLGERRLGSLESAKKVVTLRRRYINGPKKIYDEQYAQIIKDHPTPDGWEERNLPVAVLEAREFAFRALLDQEQDIADIPSHLVLTESDLPKLMKGKEGDDNQVGVASIISGLHFLFPLADDEEPVVDGKDGEQALVEEAD